MVRLEPLPELQTCFLVMRATARAIERFLVVRAASAASLEAFLEMSW